VIVRAAGGIYALAVLASVTLPDAFLAALPPTVTLVVGFLAARRKLEKIYVRVDGRLDDALSKIETLERLVTALGSPAVGQPSPSRLPGAFE
jgi:hypothetical protein